MRGCKHYNIYKQQFTPFAVVFCGYSQALHKKATAVSRAAHQLLNISQQ